MSNLISSRLINLCSKNVSTYKYGGCSLKTNLNTFMLPTLPGSLLSSAPRFLYTANYLGVDLFENQRTKVSGQFGHLKENLIERMRSTIEGKNKMIFSEDLKNSIFLISNQPEDVALLKQVISKYTEQANDIKFSTYQFGPVVMRLFYLFGDTDLAYEMLMDTKYGDFFNQERSFLIAMDLCWEQGKYQQILDLHDRFKSMEGRNNKFPRDIITLVAGSCFKLNTIESFKYCLNLFVEIREAKARLTRRAISFFSALALKQNDPDVALESLTLIDAPVNSAVLLTIRLMALASLKRIDDILYIIRNIINRGRPIERAIVLSEAIEKIDAAVESSENSEAKNDWENIKRSLQENKLIQDNLLEPVLCNPIERTVRPDQQQQFRQGFVQNERSAGGATGYRSGGYNTGGYNSGGYSSGGYNSGGYKSGNYGSSSYGSGQQRDNRFRQSNDGSRGDVGRSTGGYRRNDNYGGQRRRNYDSQFKEEGEDDSKY